MSDGVTSVDEQIRRSGHRLVTDWFLRAYCCHDCGWHITWERLRFEEDFPPCEIKAMENR